ncbi:MAG: DegT/DnrJ/EryC1/StrS family aminotransferase [Acetobacteraceae bacterium]|nr:DegT/DnrJ/EryC1/StrS family aminotransferase [Acetobacteraceae bacterium]MBV8574892.1 DegT/DnrJ/EryC1/StrS family aminotransferase [Acetobacteraceae bacterium]
MELAVPQAKPGASYEIQKNEIDQAVARVLGSGWYILGAEGRAFEQEFAAWLGAPYAVGCANGTDALALALRGLGIGVGSAVATVSHTAVATVAAIEMAGAVPVLIDIDPAHYTMNPVELAAVLEHPPAGLPPIRAVIPVHLYGQAADLPAISAVCSRHGAAMIEDCSQAHGAMLGGRRLGTFGEAACFSLYPTKNLGALGDGGIIVTADPILAERLAALRQYGWRQHYVSDLVGVNSRLDEIQAAILRVRLHQLDANNARRGAIAAHYDRVVADPPARRAGCTHVFHQYVIRVADRADTQTRLRDCGIGTGVHYPVPVHLQPAYRGRVVLGPAGCRATERAAQQVMSFPMYPELSDAQVEKVCAAFRIMQGALR